MCRCYCHAQIMRCKRCLGQPCHFYDTPTAQTKLRLIADRLTIIGKRRPARIANEKSS